MKLSSKRMWHGLTSVFSVLLVVMLGVSSAASTLETRINSIMGTASTKIEAVDSNEEVNSLYYESEFSDPEELIKYQENLNRLIVGEGTVLLKNEGNALPLGTEANVTMFGIGGVSPIYSGASGGGVIKNTKQIVPITTAFEECGIHTNTTVHDWYVSTGIPENCMIETVDFTGNASIAGPWSDEEKEVCMRAAGVTEADASGAFSEWKDSYASYGDAAIVFLCRYEGEGSDLGEGSLEISPEEQILLEEAADNFEKVIVVVNTSAAIEIDELKENPEVDAILWVSELGTHGAYGLADILNGEMNPSGHLVDTFAADSTSSPAYQNSGNFVFANAEEAGLDNFGSYYAVNAEGIYLGYKYYETRYEDCVMGTGNADSMTGTFAGSGAWNYGDEVTYGFGYGLSYTSFEQTLDEVDVDMDKQVITARVTVTNTGNMAGKDVVQIYAQSPYTDYDKENGVEKSAVQLLGYEKTQLLEVGASETVTVTMNMKYLASYDSSNAKTYILDDGDYYFAVGNGAHDALNNILAAKGYMKADGMDADGDASLASLWENDKFDKTSFAMGYDGETAITNQFEDTDYNYWKEGTVTYLSRLDWEKTWPEAYEGLEATEEMIPWLSAEQYEPGNSDTSSITTGSEDTSYALIELKGLEYDDPLWDELLNQVTGEELSALITDACEHTPEIQSISYRGSLDKDGPIGYDATFSTDTSNPYYITDSASDYVKNYNFAGLCTEPTLGAAFSHELAREKGNLNGETSLWSGYTELWAPGANLHRTPYSGRNYEYFSEDSMLSNLMSVDITVAMQEKGAVAGIKHFAGNDQETNRNGIATFYTEQGYRENQLRAFEGAFVPDEGGARGTMTAFNRMGVKQAAYCESLLTNVLRGEWGFEGYTITDFAFNNLMYPYASLTAGTDAFDNMISDFSAINAGALAQDAKLLEAARQAAHRILYTYVNSNAMNGIASNTRIVKVSPWWMQAVHGVEYTMGVLTVLCLIMFLVTDIKARKKEEA